MTTTLHINLGALNEAMVEELRQQYGPAAELEIRVPEKPETWLYESDFWQIIALLDWSKTGDDEAVIAPAVAGLAEMPLGHIHQFQDLLSRKLWLLDTRAHAAASLGNDPDAELSVDYFLYDRCCVVANGADYYEKVLHDPSQMPVGYSFSRLLSVASKAYRMKTGKDFVHIPAYNYETYSNANVWYEGFSIGDDLLEVTVVGTSEGAILEAP